MRALVAIIAAILVLFAGFGAIRWWACTDLHPGHELACMVIGR